MLWRHVEAAHLTMRAYRDRFIDWYLARAGEPSLNVVGACRLEGLGAQAFGAIDGDYFTDSRLAAAAAAGFSATARRCLWIDSIEVEHGGSGMTTIPADGRDFIA